MNSAPGGGLTVYGHAEDSIPGARRSAQAIAEKAIAKDKTKRWHIVGENFSMTGTPAYPRFECTLVFRRDSNLDVGGAHAAVDSP